MKKIRIIIFIAALIMFIYIAVTSASIYLYAGTDETRPADAAVILGAASFDGELSPVFCERVNHGIELYKNGTIDMLIMTGGTDKGSAVSEAEAARRYAVSCGVSMTDIYIEEKSKTTIENLRNSLPIVHDNNIGTVLIVSDPLHMKRSMIMARDMGLDAYSSPSRTSRYVSLKTKLPFLAREEFYYSLYLIYRSYFVILKGK